MEKIMRLGRSGVTKKVWKAWIKDYYRGLTVWKVRRAFRPGLTWAQFVIDEDVLGAKESSWEPKK